MGKHDALGRRSRHRKQPTGKAYQITERILVILERLHWYGHLPSGYLYELTKDLPRSKDRTAFIKVLGDLYHENSFRIDGQKRTLIGHDVSLLDRSSFGWYQSSVYHLNKYSEALLEEKGRFQSNAFSIHRPPSTFKHQLYASCALASIEIETKKDPDLIFIPQHEIIKSPMPEYTVSGKVVKNDGLCAIRRKSTGQTFYLFIEADRATERIGLSAKTGKSFERLVLQMKEFIGGNQYKQYVGAKPGDYGLILNLTVSEQRMRNMRDVIARHFPNGCKYILSQHYPSFGNDFTSPPIMPLLSSPWIRAGKPDYTFL